MENNWYFTCDEERKEWFARVIEALDAKAHCYFFSSARKLRHSLFQKPQGSISVLVGATSEIDPINAAATYVLDNTAKRVVLVQDYVSGSLRKRAQEAGITEVFCGKEVQELVCQSTARFGAQVEGVNSARPKSHAKEAMTATTQGESCIETEAPLPPPGEQAPKHAAVPKVTRVKGAPIFTFASARGGVGKSSIAALSALALSSWGVDVALLDLDLAFGNLFSFFGLDGPVDIYGLLGNLENVEIKKAGKRIAENATLYGPCIKPEYAEACSSHIGSLLSQLCLVHDVVVVDGSTNWTDALAEAVQSSDRVCLVSDERAGAIGSLSRATGLSERLGVARTRIVRMINRCDIKRRDEGFMVRALNGFESSNTIKIVEGDYDVDEFLGAGHAIDLFALKEPFGKSCAAGIAKLLQDVGKLPEHKAAQEALNFDALKRPRFSLFGSKAS